jgi:hypothetical protein
MNDDVRRFIYGTVAIFVIGLLVWFSFIYLSSCGFTITCNRARVLIAGTPIPTVGFAPVPVMEVADPSGKCTVLAADLMGAWVTAGSPESDMFSFNDVNGNACEGNFNEDIRPLFVEGNLWYPGSHACVTCHNTDIGKTSAANLDLTNYQGILAGSQRPSADANGTDILGGGTWEQSLLYEFTVNHPVEPPGHGENPQPGPVVFAGKASESDPSVTPTPTP